jgi:hypothetical protein
MRFSTQASERCGELASVLALRSPKSLLLAAGVLTLIGCGGSNAPPASSASGTGPKQAIHVASIKASDPGNGQLALRHVVGPEAGLGDVYFESTASFPITLSLDLDPSENHAVRTYAFITGNHGNHGSDSILRMPRGWTLSGSDDGTNWVVLDKQQLTTMWQPNEERRFTLASPSRHKHFRIELTESGPEPILRIYGIKLYSN